MKKLPFLCATILFGNFLFGQSHTLKFGTLVPINNKAITILPTTPNDDGLVSAPKPAGQSILLVGGSMNPLTNDGNNLILSNSNSLTYNGAQAPLLLIPVPSKPKTTSGNNSKATSINSQSLTANDNNSLISLTDYGTSGSKSVQSSSGNNSSNFQSLISPSSQVTSTPSPANVSLEPLTYTAPKAKVQTGAETLDPSRINASLNNTTNSQKVVANSYFKNTPQETLPPRNSVSRTKMPELAPIEGTNEATNSSTSYSKNQNSGMPELAPIEGQNNVATKTNQSLMPELAPLEEEQTEEAKQNNNQNQDLKPENSNRVRGFLIPKGTLLKANETKSYIIKPAAPIKNIVPFKPNDSDELIGTKPSAGGGIFFLADEEEVNNNYVSLTDLVETPIQNNQTQQQLQQAAKNHQHDPNNPCCRVQINNTAKKKVAYKKPVHRKRKTYVQQPTIVYAYKQDPVKTQNVERIVYVPVQQTQQETKQTVQTYKPQVAQPVQPSKSQERVVYRDYTNTYTKANPSSQPECNCPGSNQNVGANKDNKKYYNPNNYAAGLNSGPTSGDYPVSGNSSDADMKYTFYVNSRGKYGVSIYNNNCSVLLQQNGKVVEFKVYGDPKTDQPKLNYFGSPESIAGIPIEYNYNRTVHKIGNIKFDYDFEGFFKTVGNSNVFYTSRSTLSKVDNTNVRYDAGGNVTSVDQNNGIVQYNP